MSVANSDPRAELLKKLRSSPLYARWAGCHLSRNVTLSQNIVQELCIRPQHKFDEVQLPVFPDFQLQLSFFQVLHRQPGGCFPSVCWSKVSQNSGAPIRSRIRDLVPNGTNVPIWSRKSPDFACKSRISDSTFRCNTVLQRRVGAK